MTEVIDLLEQRVNAVVDLVQHLRREVSRLEGELAQSSPAPAARTLQPAPLEPPGDRLVEEVARLRDERTAIRERIRGLIREIDQVSW